MIKSNKAIVFLLLFLLILIAGCKGKKNVEKSLEEIRTGTEGIVISYLPNAPPSTIHAEQSADNTFDVVLEVRNKGAFPQPDEVAELGPSFGIIYLSGHDPNIITFRSTESKSTASSNYINLNTRTLDGKSTINPNGGQEVISFTGQVYVDNLKVEKYDTTLLATACYMYGTTVGPSVCIDPNPYSTTREKKVCQVNDLTLTNQGAPIAIIKIDEEAFALKTQFKITIKNVGNGEVIKKDLFSKCIPVSGEQKIVREDIDKVYVDEVRISNTLLNCAPFSEGNVQDTKGFIRLINNEGFIICELPISAYGQTNTAYTTPLKIKLSYVYRNSVERKLQIKKEMGTLGGASSGTGGGGASTPSEGFTVPQEVLDTI